MKLHKSKFVVKLLAGILGSTILVIPGIIIFVNNNKVCWPFSGYGIEGTDVKVINSCVISGGATSIILGAILGSLIISLIKIRNYKKTSIYILSAWAILFFSIVTFLLQHN